MGYTLKIGKLKTSISSDGLYSFIVNTAESFTLLEAPAFGEPTDYTNERWPSYNGWANAMRFIGLEDLMFNKTTGLLRQHPGCVPLVKEHKKIIDDAYEAFYKKYPDCKAGYSQKQLEDAFGEDEEWPEENSWAVRLEWLKFWVDWALANCETPVFYNS